MIRKPDREPAEMTPSPEAVEAVRSSERDLQSAVRMTSEADQVFSELRGHLEANHFAQRVRLAFRGVA